MFVRLPNVPNVAHNVLVGSRLNPFWELRKPWGWTLGSTNVEGGLHSPLPVKTKLDKVTKIINCYVHHHRNLYWLEALHQLEMQLSQFKISGLLQPFLVPKPHNYWRPILDLSKPNLSETIRTTLQQGEWLPQ